MADHEHHEHSHASRKFRLTLLTMLLIVLLGALSAQYASMAANLTVLVGGLLGALSIYCGANVSAKWVHGHNNKNKSSEKDNHG